MRILSVTPEFYPLVKTGGLADVAGALPLALAPLGMDMRTLLPAYPAVRAALPQAGPVAELADLFGGPARLLAGRSAEGAELFLLEAPHLYDRPGNPYLGPDGADWPDNHHRFAALAWVAAELGRGLLDWWRPEIVHGHDWQAGLAPAYLALAGGPRPKTVLTVHNLAFQGVFPAYQLNGLRLPVSAFAVEGVEYFGQIGFLKAGLFYADRLTTVSPTYAREIQTPEQGMGLDGLLRRRAGELVGIANGIDTEVWNPATDPALAAAYTAEDPDGRARNRAAVQARFGLEPDPDACLFCIVSRLTHQKGIDLVLEVLPQLLAGGGQLAVLGSGDARSSARSRPRSSSMPAGWASCAATTSRSRT